MDSCLPTTGTAELLQLLDAQIPDEFINDTAHYRPARGQQIRLSPAQLWRIHLLALLTPVHQFNLLLGMLAEQPAWRQFAHLRNRRDLPDARMLHEFRFRMGVTGLRKINDFLCQDFVEQAAGWEQSVGLIDATDLPASCRGFKKKKPEPTPPTAPP
jgi:hypothetical protein